MPWQGVGHGRISGLAMRKLGEIILFGESRKVGFGFHIYVVSTALLIAKLISPNEWLTCIFLASTLIGGGTVIDTYLKGKNGPPAPEKH